MTRKTILDELREIEGRPPLLETELTPEQISVLDALDQLIAQKHEPAAIESNVLRFPTRKAPRNSAIDEEDK